MNTKTSNTTQHDLPGVAATSERPAENAHGRSGGNSNSATANRSTHIERAVKRRLARKAIRATMEFQRAGR